VEARNHWQEEYEQDILAEYKPADAIFSVKAKASHAMSSHIIAILASNRRFREKIFQTRR